MNGRNERECMMLRVQQACFAADETRLYLDTHPCDPKALAEMQRYQTLAAQAIAAYTEQFGPLTSGGSGVVSGSWAWGEGPWPWERRC